MSLTVNTPPMPTDAAPAADGPAFDTLRWRLAMLRARGARGARRTRARRHVWSGSPSRVRI